jgi:O-antigen/teichoic acid export membrane protein
MIYKLKTKIYNLLRWSERYFKTDMVYLARGGFWLNLGQAISSLSSFLLAIAFANLLPKEIYGNYRYVLSVAGILAIPTLSGMGTAVAQAVARGYEGSLIPALKTKIRWGLLGGLASLILAGYYFYQGNTTLTISFLISAVFLPFMDSFGIYDSLLQGRKLFDISTKYFIISQIIAIASLIAVLFFTKNLFLILLTYFASWTLMRFIFFKTTLKKFSLNQNQDPQTISYGKHLSLMGVIGTIASYLDRLLIFHYLGAAEVAIYSIAIAPPEQIKGFLGLLDTLVFPKFSEKNINEIKSGIRDKFIKLVFLGILIIGGYILIAPFLYKIFFPKYSESVFYSQLFALSMLNLPFFLFGSILKAKAKIKEQYIANFIMPFLQIVLMTVFIIWQGILGLIIARIIIRLVAGFLNFFLYRQAFYIKRNSYQRRSWTK